MEKIVFTDIDGTLINDHGEITPLTRDAIRELQRRGIPFVIISSRFPAGIYPLVDDYGLRCPIVAYSGGRILDEERNVLYQKGMPKQKAREIIAFMEESLPDVVWSVFSGDQWIVKDNRHPRVMEQEALVNIRSAVGTLDTARGEEINKVLCICDPGETARTEEVLKQRFPECAVVRSTPTLVEVMPAGLTKATAVAHLCKIWNISPAQAVAFGDNFNDLEMLEAVGTGILMGNAPEALKSRIPHHTRDNNHDGIYHALRGLNMI